MQCSVRMICLFFLYLCVGVNFISNLTTRQDKKRFYFECSIRTPVVWNGKLLHKHRKFIGKINAIAHRRRKMNELFFSNYCFWIGEIWTRLHLFFAFFKNWFLFLLIFVFLLEFSLFILRIRKLIKLFEKNFCVTRFRIFEITKKQKTFD